VPKDNLLRMDKLKPKYIIFWTKNFVFYTNKFLEEPGTFGLTKNFLVNARKKAFSYWFTKINSK
jgi:hypothetical protein